MAPATDVVLRILQSICTLCSPVVALWIYIRSKNKPELPESKPNTRPSGFPWWLVPLLGIMFNIGALVIDLRKSTPITAHRVFAIANDTGGIYFCITLSFIAGVQHALLNITRNIIDSQGNQLDLQGRILDLIGVSKGGDNAS